MFEITKICTRYPRMTIGLLVAWTLLFSFFAIRVERDNSMERMLPPDEPIRATFDKFRRHFDIKSRLVLAIEHPGGVFTPEILAQVDRLSGQLAELKLIDKVQSLTNVENITAADGMIKVSPLADRLPKTSEQIEAFARKARSNPMIVRGLVSEDEKATILFAQPTFMPYETEKSMACHTAVAALVAADPGPGTIHLAGLPVVVGLINQYMDRDNRVMLPLVTLLVIFVLWLSFRAVRGVWIPVSVVVAAVLWTFGAMGLAGVRINIISTSVPIVLVAMGIADGIHVLHEYFHNLEKGKENVTAVLDTMRQINSPVIMTSLTTAAGFMALCVSQIVPIREYGVAVAFGILAAMVFSLTFIPACLVLLGRPKRFSTFRLASQGALGTLSKSIGRFSIRHSRLILIAFAVMLLLTVVLSSRLKVRNNPVHYFRSHSAIRTADDFLNRHFAGTGEINVLFDAGEPGAAKDPGLMDRLNQLQNRLETVPKVGRTRSLADYLKRMNFVLNDDDPVYDRVPGTPIDLGPQGTTEEGRAKIAQYLLLYETSGGEELARMVDFTYRRAVLSILIQSNNSQDYQLILDRFEREYEQIFEKNHATIESTGAGIINLKVVQYLVLGQIASLVLSFLVVFVMLVVLFRSLRVALIASIPLVITVSTNFAVMVLTAIPLNMGTALIANVIIGVGVDYSIHFIHRFRIERKRTDRFSAAVQTTMDTSGRAILFNALSVGGGFAILIFSSFMPLVYLGILVPLVMAVNALAALVVIPACLNQFRVG